MEYAFKPTNRVARFLSAMETSEQAEQASGTATSEALPRYRRIHQETFVKLYNRFRENLPAEKRRSTTPLLAKKSGLSEATIRRLRNKGILEPDHATVSGLLDALPATQEELFEPPNQSANNAIGADDPATAARIRKALVLFKSPNHAVALSTVIDAMYRDLVAD